MTSPIGASTLDSLLDLIAGGILWFTHLSMKNINIYQYPIGKLRVHPVGIVIFVAVMATLGFQVLVEVVQQLIRNEPSLKMTFEQLVCLYVIMGIATVVKFVLWVYCRSSRNRIVRAYAKVFNSPFEIFLVFFIATDAMQSIYKSKGLNQIVPFYVQS